MPFQSEKQRRYLWANEPEIARDWTDTYGSGIAKALGGRIGFFKGAQADASAGRGSMSPGTSSSGGSRGGGGPPGGGATSQGSGRDVYTAPINRHKGPSTRSRIQDERQEDFRKKQMADLLARQQAEKDYTRQGIMKAGPQLGLARSGGGPNIGNWASGFAGSKIGGGLGSMLFGPWGALLGALFGRGVGQRAYQAYQTPEEETAQDILLGQNTLLSNLFSKKKTPNTMGGEGLGGIDLSDMRDKRSAKDYIDLAKSYSEFDTIPNRKYHGLNVQRNYMGQPIRSDLVQEVRLTDIQKKGLDAKKNHYKMGLIDADQVWDSIKPWDDPEDPSTKQEVIEYLKT